MTMEAEKLKEAFQYAKNLETTTGNSKKAIKSYSDFIKNCHSFLDELNGKNSDTNISEITELLAQAFNNRGLLKYLQVDFDEAIDDYSKGLSFDKSMYYSYYNRGLIHYRLARFDEAIKDMKKVLQLKPDFEPAQKCLQQSQIDGQKIRTS